MLFISGCTTSQDEEIAALKEQLRQKEIAEKLQQEQFRAEQERREREEFEERVRRQAQEEAERLIQERLKEIEKNNEREKRDTQQRQEKAEEIERLQKEQADRDTQRLETNLHQFGTDLSDLTINIENIKSQMDMIPPQDRKQSHVNQQNNLIIEFNELVESYQSLDSDLKSQTTDPITAAARFESMSQGLLTLMDRFDQLDDEVTTYADQTKILPWPGSTERNSRRMSPILLDNIRSEQPQ